jgi:hypothetical protein
MHWSNLEFRSSFAALSVALMLLALWQMMHGYQGLTGDGQIYAFQSFARLHPHLETDLYLQNTSQDRFTLFSPFYTLWIGLLGVENAARVLTLLFTLWFLGAAWSFIVTVAGRKTAFAAVGLLLIVPGNYGGSAVFRVVEPFLTARLPAQALVLTALCCQARGRPWLSLSLALAALLVHPLMALPGLALLVGLWLPSRVTVLAAIGIVLATSVIAIVSVHLPTVSHVFTVMDAPWLSVVRERSQFLFLQLWSRRDWETNAQPFLCLAFTAFAVSNARIRKLCAASALVGGAGLAVAFVGGLVGPVAIIVQGQAWRWVWITVLVSVLTTPFTALRVWRDESCGPLCAILLVSGWILPGDGGTICVALALSLWSVRARISRRAAGVLTLLSAALVVGIVGWLVVKSLAIVWTPTKAAAVAPFGVVKLQDLFALRLPAIALTALVWWGIGGSRAPWVPLLLSAMLAVLLSLLLPLAFKQSRTLASTDTQEYADWTNVIPPTSTVLVVPPRDAGMFVWFTLNRPNYLALDQSAGVVFSRATALEIQRRSDVLLPLTDPDWRIFSRLRSRTDGRTGNEPATRPLTARILSEVCADPQLGFVISPGKVGFNSLPHTHDGPWKNWSLYDCREVRSELLPT